MAAANDGTAGGGRQQLCLKYGVCTKRKGHSGAHKGVASWNSAKYTTEGKQPSRRYDRKFPHVPKGGSSSANNKQNDNALPG